MMMMMMKMLRTTTMTMTLWKTTIKKWTTMKRMAPVPLEQQ